MQTDEAVGTAVAPAIWRMPRCCAALLLALQGLSCSARPDSSTPAAPPVAAASPATAPEILRQLSLRLRKCKTYRDTGRVTVEINGEIESRSTFRTAFVRPDRYVFQYGGTQPDGKDGDGFIWASGVEVLNRRLAPPTWRIPGRSGLSRALDATHPPGELTARDVAGLLLGQNVPPSSLSLLDGVALVGEERVDDDVCQLLRAPSPSGKGTTTAWVDASNLLLRRVVRASDDATAGVHSVETVDYVPEVDVEIRADELVLESEIPRAGAYALELKVKLDAALPDRVRLSEGVKGTDDYVRGEVSPGLPPEHTFSGKSYWAVGPHGLLSIVWSNGHSGITLELKPVGQDDWAGTARISWDFPSRSEPVTSASLRRTGD